jgi:rRNA maturation endonuclease Nob1
MKFAKIPFEDFERMAKLTDDPKYVKRCGLCNEKFATTDGRKKFCSARCANTIAKRMERMRKGETERCKQS